jgi:glycosyltransferase involved in cell wall biosynthesis
MRIALFHDLPSGGAKRALHAQVAGLRARGHEVVAFLPATADESFLPLGDIVSATHIIPRRRPPPDRERVLAGTGSLLDPLRWLRFLASLPADEAAIAAAIDATKPDVVMVHPSQFTQAPCVLRALRTPSVYYCQEPLRAAYEPRVVAPHIRLGLRLTLARVDRRNARAATVVAVNSQFSRARIAQVYGIAPEVVPLGVDTTVFQPQPGALGGYILSVGALHPLKGHDTVIDTVAALPAAQRLPVLIISDRWRDAERARLEARAAAAGVALRIEVRVDEATLVARYAAANVVMYTPHNEPFGFVALEAMACGRPVLGVAEGGLLETIVHERTGYVEQRDPQKLAVRLAALLSDPVLADTLGANGAAHVRAQWGWDTAVTSLEQLLTRVASR